MSKPTKEYQVWKPDDHRWVVIDSEGNLSDVTQLAENEFMVTCHTPEAEAILVVKEFERTMQAELGVGHTSIKLRLP